jgi:hypothetical protein
VPDEFKKGTHMIENRRNVMSKFTVDVTLTVTTSGFDAEDVWAKANRLASHLVELAEYKGYDVELQDIDEPEEMED